MAEQNLFVLPFEPGGKKPVGWLLPHGYKDASSDPATVDGWWRQLPAGNIGMATGQINGVAVVDIDYRAGAEEDEFPPTWRKTMVIQTPNGVHLWYSIPGGQPSYREVAGIGLKADGGYVIVPPSYTERPYELFKDQRPLSLPAEWLAPFECKRVFERQPPKVKERLRNRQFDRKVHIYCSARLWADAAVRNEVEYVERAQVGERNIELNVAAFALGQIVPTGWLSERGVTVALSRAAERVGLEPSSHRTSDRPSPAASRKSRERAGPPLSPRAT